MLERSSEGKNLKSMGIISKVVRPNFIPSKDDICEIRIPVDNFPIFTKIDPPEVMAYYMESCLKDGVEPLVDPFNLPETYSDFHRKRKNDSREEGSSRPQKKKKVVVFFDEDEMPLSERQKEILLKDTSSVIQKSSKAYETTTSRKLSEASNLIVSDSIISEIILPTQSPPPFLNQFLSNQFLIIFYFHLP